ncbi:phosphoesterase-like protein, putative [Bodo saltans]|uniref:Purple acid phosphatase n=1 Tax=Bodo saltans TaxID=75058 RepID=A0A0S4J0B2_BODSA|nr:phosphoesterase-like protein, putative [Bodo saltans]|eukprot:CUG36983.1 phosphoesterase-like protein, putative [Bodo saltans]
MSTKLLVLLALVLVCALGHKDYERDEDLPHRWRDTDYQNNRIANEQHEMNEIAHSFRRVLREGKSTGCKDCELAAQIFFEIGQNKAALNDTTGALLRDACVDMFRNSTFDLDICFDVVGTLVVLVNKGLVLLNGWQVDFKEVVCADFLFYCVKPCCLLPYAPEQVRLSYRDSNPVGNSTAMSVGWVTLKQTPDAVVEWWTPSTPKSTNNASWNTYNHGGWIGIIHNATMSSLTADTLYTYRVGSDALGWSQEFTFKTLPLNIGTAERPLRVIGIADMGWAEAAQPTIAAIQAMVNNGTVDFVIHPGDIGYADGNEAWWDVFGREMEPITSRIPYMTVIGNHESIWWNGTGYKERWFRPDANMGAPSDSTFYQLNVGPVTFMMLDSETAWNTADYGQAQLNWMQLAFNDARSNGQLIFAAHHRPFYCSSNAIVDCTTLAVNLRSQAEALYKATGVSTVMCGHVHNYERTFPVYDNITDVNSTYSNVADPYYIVNGAAGNREGTSNFYTTSNLWSAVRLENIGYTVLEFVRQGGEDTFNMRFIDSASGQLLDQVILTKNVTTSQRH